MAPCIAIAAHQAERGWRQEEIAANIQDEESPNEVLTPTASDDVAAVDKDNGMEGLDDTQIALRIGQPRLTAAAVNRAKKVAPRTRTPTLSTSAAEAASVGEKVAAAGQEPQQPQTRQHSPLGCLFRPELDKAEVIDVVSDVVCRPGFTRGPGDDRRLLKSVRTGRVDVRCMSRLLRWLAGDRVARELRERGVEFIGPKGLEAAEPYTTGQGMQRLVQEVSQGVNCCLCSPPVCAVLEIRSHRLRIGRPQFTDASHDARIASKYTGRKYRPCLRTSFSKHQVERWKKASRMTERKRRNSPTNIPRTERANVSKFENLGNATWRSSRQPGVRPRKCRTRLQSTSEQPSSRGAPWYRSFWTRLMQQSNLVARKEVLWCAGA